MVTVIHLHSGLPASHRFGTDYFSTKAHPGVVPSFHRYHVIPNVFFNCIKSSAPWKSSPPRGTKCKREKTQQKILWSHFNLLAQRFMTSWISRKRRALTRGGLPTMPASCQPITEEDDDGQKHKRVTQSLCHSTTADQWYITR